MPLAASPPTVASAADHSSVATANSSLGKSAQTAAQRTRPQPQRSRSKSAVRLQQAGKQLASRIEKRAQQARAARKQRAAEGEPQLGACAAASGGGGSGRYQLLDPERALPSVKLGSGSAVSVLSSLYVALRHKQFEKVRLLGLQVLRQEPGNELVKQVLLKVALIQRDQEDSDGESDSEDSSADADADEDADPSGAVGEFGEISSALQVVHFTEGDSAQVTRAASEEEVG